MANKKKILIVTDAWHPQKNGVVVSIEKMETLLTEKGFAVFVAHPHLFPLRMRLFFYPEIEIALFVKQKMRKLFEREKPDFVHITTEGPLGLAARMYCVRHKIRFTTAYHTHYPLYAELRIPGVFNLAYRYVTWFHRGASRTMVATHAMKKDLEERDFNNLVIWPLGVETHIFKKNPVAPVPEFLRDMPRPFFIYFGRVAIEKNVEAFLKCDLPGTKIVVGGGPQLSSLKKRYKKGVVFVRGNGYAKDKELIDLLSIADVFVFPSKTETLGIVALEALACELPVAAYDAMGPREIIVNGVHGFIDQDLARAARQCLTIPRTELRQRAMKFTWDHSVEAFLENLEEN